MDLYRTIKKVILGSTTSGTTGGTQNTTYSSNEVNEEETWLYYETSPNAVCESPVSLLVFSCFPNSSIHALCIDEEVIITFFPYDLVSNEKPVQTIDIQEV